MLVMKMKVPGLAPGARHRIFRVKFNLRCDNSNDEIIVHICESCAKM